MRTIPFFLILCLCMPSMTYAGPIRDSICQIARGIVSPAGAAEWQVRLAEAEEKRNDGKKWMLTGAGMSAVAVLLMAVNKSNEAHFGGGNPENEFYAWMGLLAGGGMAAYGGLRYSSASSRVRELEREGRSKGYIVIGPAPGKGISINAGLRF